MNYWQERAQSYSTYIMITVVLVLLLSGLFGLYRHFFPKKVQPTSSSSVGRVESGGVSNITNVNYKPEDTSQGLYVSLSSDRATVGVYKEFTSRFEVQLGAGKDYDDKAVAEVTGKVKF